MYKILHTTGFLFLVALFVTPLQSTAQSGDFEEGYVVTNSKDTLYGKIRDRKTGAFGKLFKKVKFKGKGGKSKYAPKEIISYRIGRSLFESLPLISNGSLFEDRFIVSSDGDYQFLKVVEKSYLGYYLMEYEDLDSGYIDNIAYFKKKDGNTLVRVNQGLFGLKRKSLARFFSDCPELEQKIQLKEIKTALEIVHFYNEWKAKSP